MMVSWQPPPFEHRNGIITGYSIRVIQQNTDSEESIDWPVNNNTDNIIMVVNDLHPFYTYGFSVAAYTTVGLGPFSTSVIQKLPESR